MPVKVSLFITCLTDLFYPDTGEAILGLLRRQGVQVEFPLGQTCCGQPAYNGGFHDEARQMAAQWVKAFSGSDYIVTPSGSCAAMVRNYYPDLVPEAKSLSERTFEFSQFLVDVLGVEDVGARFPARVAYHQSCHMTRELNLTRQPLALLQNVRELELVEVPRQELCCGFGGSFAVKMPEISEAMVCDKVAAVASTGAEVLVSSDNSCLMNIGGRINREQRSIRVMHIADLLWEGVQGRA